MHPEIQLDDVDIIFGSNPMVAANLLDQGKNREEILSETGNVVGVCNASLTVNKGEICVLMGLSGSGKSTLLRAVNGLNKVTRGKVLLNHENNQIDLAKVGSAELRQIRMNRVSMVFQQFALLPWRTVAQNVGLGLEMRGMTRSERSEIVDQKLDMVGLMQWRDKYAHELSGGMQQRVGLARAFATDADILLMDEPFSALDPLIRNHLQDELLDLQNTLHKTVLFVSHDLDEAIKLGSSIAIMESGRIVQFGTPEDIVLNPVNQYVSDFVAHMNPVGVLRAKSIMTSIDKFPQDNSECVIEPYSLEVKMSDSGQPVTVMKNGQEMKTEKWDENTSAQSNILYMASDETSMKNTIEICHESGNPVLLCKDNGDTLVGVVGNSEIYSAILHRQNSS